MGMKSSLCSSVISSQHFNPDEMTGCDLQLAWIFSRTKTKASPGGRWRAEGQAKILHEVNLSQKIALLFRVKSGHRHETQIESLSVVFLCTPVKLFLFSKCRMFAFVVDVCQLVLMLLQLDVSYVFL